MRKQLVLLLLATCANLVLAQVPPTPTKPTAPIPLTIVHAEFGIFHSAKGDTALNFEPSTRIPRQTGQRYGWVIEISPPKPHVSVREEYLLPQNLAPGRKRIENALETILERRLQVSQRYLAAINGRLYGEWEIGPDEPTGHRHLQVIIEDHTVADFEFDVETNATAH